MSNIGVITVNLPSILKFIGLSGKIFASPYQDESSEEEWYMVDSLESIDPADALDNSNDDLLDQDSSNLITDTTDIDVSSQKTYSEPFENSYDSSLLEEINYQVSEDENTLSWDSLFKSSENVSANSLPQESHNMFAAKDNILSIEDIGLTIEGGGLIFEKDDHLAQDLTIENQSAPEHEIPTETSEIDNSLTNIEVNPVTHDWS